jgi:cation diffusion facilitator CzcD-associated flavoprotein CzcO
MSTSSSTDGATVSPIAIIGAGFAGIGMGIRLKERGIHSFTIFEGADRVGGTWRDNTYPGCACDVPSHVYSFSFERNPDWSRNFSPQPEILAYLERCVERYGLAPHIRFGRWIERAEWDDDAALWRLTDATGAQHTARVLVAGTGPLREPTIPELPGLDRFEGEVMHSARWNHDYDFSGKRVATVGTGASAIQFVPQLAERVESLHVFQRTPPWVLPKFDAAFPEAVRARFRAHPSLTFLYRNLWYWISEAFGTGFFGTHGEGWREKLAHWYRERTIADPELRAKVTPDYAMGCKRVLFTNDYYPALNRDNVELVASGVERITPRSVVASDGTEREVDAICFGTGFAATDFLAPLRVRGRRGLDLNDAWREGAEAYYGITVSGFPNLFLLAGPNTGLGHNSIVFMIEAQVHYVLQCLERMRERGLAWLDVKPAAQRRFNDRLQDRLKDAVWNAGGCTSWYLDENGKNVTLWPGLTAEYWLRTRRVDWRAYHEEPARRRAPAAPPATAAAAE